MSTPVCRVACPTPPEPEPAGLQPQCKFIDKETVQCRSGDGFCIAYRKTNGEGCSETDNWCQQPGGAITLASCPSITSTKSTILSTSSSTQSSSSGTTTQFDPTLSTSTTMSGTLAFSSGSTNSNSTMSTTATPQIPVPATATPSQTSIIIPSNKVLNAGEAAGIAIGCLLAGALIAGIIAILVSRRKRKQSPELQHSNYNVSDRGTRNHEKPYGAVGVTSFGGVEEYIPLPAEDVAITSELSRLRGKIKDHVQSFYTTSTGNPVLDHAKLLGLGTAIDLSPRKLDEILQNPETRLAGLRLYLAWTIMTRCGLDRIETKNSLLPAEVADFASVLASGTDRTPATLMLATRWKAISGALLQQSQQHGSNSRAEYRNRIVADATNNILTPFAVGALDGSNEEKRLRNLDGILKKASQFAFLLFSQKSIYVLDWTNPSGRGVVVFPGLHRVVDDDGIVCNPPQVLAPPEVEV